MKIIELLRKLIAQADGERAVGNLRAAEAFAGYQAGKRYGAAVGINSTLRLGC